MIDLSTTAYLDDDSERLAKKLREQNSYDSVSEVVKEALKLMEQNLIEERLREKYRGEPPIENLIEDAQAETAEELGDYPW